jgi:hypothetical protein
MLARLPTHLNICRFYHSWLEPDWGAMDAAPRASVAAATSAFVASASSTPKHQSRSAMASAAAAAAAATVPTPTMTARGSQSLSATALAKDDPIVHPWSSTSGASPMVMRFAEFSGVPCADHRPVDELNDGWDRAVSTEAHTQRGGGMGGLGGLGGLGGRHRDDDDQDDDAAVGSRSGTLSPASSSDPFGSTGGGVDAVGASTGASRRASALAASAQPLKPVVRSSKVSAAAGTAHELHCCCCLGCDAHVCCTDGKKLGVDVALADSTAAETKIGKYASLPSPASSSASKKRSNRKRINSHDDDGGGFDFSQWNHGDEDEDAEESTQNGGADDESEEDEDESEDESDEDDEDEEDSNHDDEDEDDDVDAFDASENGVISASGIPIPKSVNASARRKSSAGAATGAAASTLASANGAVTAASSSAAAAAARTDDDISGSPLRLGDGFDASSMGSLPTHKLSSSLSPASVAMQYSGSPPTWIGTFNVCFLSTLQARPHMISFVCAFSSCY